MTDAGHKRSLVVWDVPSAIACGERFSVTIGVRCEEACELAGSTVEVRDHDGVTRAVVETGEATWPGTEALYHATVSLEAPDSEGLAVWEAVVPDAESAQGKETATVHHQAAREPFNVRTVPEGDCRLTVIAIDRASQVPVSGARVVVHPWRELTDEQGIAELHLPRGQYRLFVSGREYFPLRLDGELNSDTTIRAELEIDREPDDAEQWS